MCAKAHAVMARVMTMKSKMCTVSDKLFIPDEDVGYIQTNNHQGIVN